MVEEILKRRNTVCVELREVRRNRKVLERRVANQERLRMSTRKATPKCVRRRADVRLSTRHPQRTSAPTNSRICRGKVLKMPSSGHVAGSARVTNSTPADVSAKSIVSYIVVRESVPYFRGGTSATGPLKHIQQVEALILGKSRKANH